MAPPLPATFSRADATGGVPASQTTQMLSERLPAAKIRGARHKRRHLTCHNKMRHCLEPRPRLYAFVPDNWAIEKEIAMGTDANGPSKFSISFLDAEGALIQTVSLSSDTVSSATVCASEIATELGAINFFITAAPYSSMEATALASPSIAKRLAPLGRFLSSNVDPLWLGAVSRQGENHQ